MVADRTIGNWFNVTEQMDVYEDQAGGVALLDCSVVVIERQSGRALSPLVGGYPLYTTINGSQYPIGEPVELTAADARLPIEVTWRLVPQDEDSELQFDAGPPNTNQQSLLYTWNSASRPLDAELRPALGYSLRASTFIANVTGTFDGLPLWNSDGYPRRALSASMGDNFTMVPLPSVDRTLQIRVLDRPEPPTLRTDALTIDRRVMFAASISLDDRLASQTPVLLSQYDVLNYMQALGVVQGTPGGFPVGQPLQFEEQDEGQQVSFSLRAAAPQDWRHLSTGLVGTQVSAAYFWEAADGEAEYVEQAFQISVEQSRKAIGDTGRTTTLFDVSIQVKAEADGGFPILPPVPGASLPGARQRQFIMVEMLAEDNGGNRTSVLLNVTVEPFEGNGILARPDLVSFEVTPEAPLENTFVGLLMGPTRAWRLGVDYPDDLPGQEVGPRWVQPGTDEGSGPTLLNLEVNATGLTAGVYTSTVQAEAILEDGEELEEDDRTASIQVSMEVIAPDIVFQPSSIVADAQPGKDIQVEMTIQNPGTGTLDVVLQVVEPIEVIDDATVSQETDPDLPTGLLVPQQGTDLGSSGGIVGFGRRRLRHSVWQPLGAGAPMARRGRQLLSLSNGTSLPIPAEYNPAPSWARLALGAARAVEMHLSLGPGRGTQISLSNKPAVDAKPEDLQAALLVHTNVPDKELEVIPWRLRVSWAQVCPTLTRFDANPAPGESAVSFFDVSNQSPFEMQFAFEFAADVLAEERIDSNIIEQTQAVIARVGDTSLPSDGTVRRVAMQLFYSPEVFVPPGTEFSIPLYVHSWKRDPLEQAALDRDGPTGLVLQPWLGIGDFSTSAQGTSVGASGVDSRTSGQTIDAYLDGIDAENRQKQRVDVLFTLSVGPLSPVFSTFSPLPSGIQWPPTTSVNDRYPQLTSFLTDEIQRRSLIDESEGLAGEWAHFLAEEPLQFPERVLTSDATYTFYVVLSDSRQQRTWLRPSQGERLEVRVLPDDALTIRSYLGSSVSTGQTAPATDLADATVTQDLNARGTYRVTLQFRRTGAGRLFVRFASNDAPSGTVLRSFTTPGQLQSLQTPGVRLSVPGATCDAAAGLVRDKDTQLRCVCAAGYFKQNDFCAPCPVGSTKAEGGNDTSCSRCESAQFSLGRQYPCMQCPDGVIADGSTTGGLRCVNGQPDIFSTGFWFESPAAHLDHLIKVTVPRYREYAAAAVQREASIDQRALPRHVQLLASTDYAGDSGAIEAPINETEEAIRMERAGQMHIDPDTGEVQLWGPEGFPVPFPPLQQNLATGRIEFNRSITFTADENGTLIEAPSSTGPTGAYELLEEAGVLGPLLADAFRGAVPRMWWLYLTSAREELLSSQGIPFDEPTAGGVFQSSEGLDEVRLGLPIILPCVVDGTCLFDLPEQQPITRNETFDCINGTSSFNYTQYQMTLELGEEDPGELEACLERARLLDAELQANVTMLASFIEPEFFDDVYSSDPFRKVANCSLGHTGSVCAECAEGFASSSGLVGTCQPCWSRGASWVLTVVVLGLVFGMVGYLSLKRARAAKLVDDFEGQVKKAARRRLDGQLGSMSGDADALSRRTTVGGHESGTRRSRTGSGELRGESGKDQPKGGRRLVRRLSAKERGAPPPPGRKRAPAPPPRSRQPPSFWQIRAPKHDDEGVDGATAQGYQGNSPTARRLLVAEGGGQAEGDAVAGVPSGDARLSASVSNELEGSSQSVEHPSHEDSLDRRLHDGSGRGGRGTKGSSPTTPGDSQMQLVSLAATPSSRSVADAAEGVSIARTPRPPSPAHSDGGDDSSNQQSKTSTTISIARVIINYMQALSLLQAPSSPMLNNSLKSASVSDGVALGLHPIQCAFQFSLFDRLYVTLALPIAAVAVPLLIAMVVAVFQWFEWCEKPDSAVDARINERLNVQGSMAFAGAVPEVPADVGQTRGRSATTGVGGGRRRRRNMAVVGGMGGAAPSASPDGSTSQQAAEAAQSKGRWFRVLLQDNVNKAVTASVVVLFLLHQSVSKMIMNLFATYDYRIYGRTLLQADMSVSTSDGGYTVAYAMGWVGVVLYVFGIPIAGAYILSSLSRSGDLAKGNTIARWGFLYAGLSLKRPLRFLWELVVIARKLALIGIATLITQSVMTQGLAALLVLLAAIVLQLLAKPFDSRTLNYLEMSALGVLIVTQIGILFIELQHSVATAVFLIAFNVGFLVIAVAIIFMSADDQITDVITKVQLFCKPVTVAASSSTRSLLHLVGLDDGRGPAGSDTGIGRGRVRQNTSSGPGFVHNVEMTPTQGTGGSSRGLLPALGGSPSGAASGSTRPTFDFGSVSLAASGAAAAVKSRRGSFRQINPMQRAATVSSHIGGASGKTAGASTVSPLRQAVSARWQSAAKATRSLDEAAPSPAPATPGRSAAAKASLRALGSSDRAVGRAAEKSEDDIRAHKSRQM